MSEQTLIPINTYNKSERRIYNELWDLLPQGDRQSNAQVQDITEQVVEARDNLREYNKDYVHVENAQIHLNECVLKVIWQRSPYLT